MKPNGQSSDTPDKETATTGVAKFCKWVWKKADQGMNTWKSSPVPDTNRTSSVLCAGWESWKTERKQFTLPKSFGQLTTKSRACYQKGQELCDLIWKRADQGMKTWKRINLFQRCFTQHQLFKRTLVPPLCSALAGKVERKKTRKIRVGHQKLKRKQ